MISDDERREVVARLREWLAIPWYERQWSRDAMQSLGEMVGAVPGEDIVERIANLIDRPTCQLVLTDTETHGNTKVRCYECSECGGACEEIYGKYERCPHCGAMVSENGGCDVREL